MAVAAARHLWPYEVGEKLEPENLPEARAVIAPVPGGALPAS